MPPGQSVVSVLPITESGVIAARSRRPGVGGEELADAAVGDPHHPDFVVEHPGLVGDRLDHVVAVEVLQRFEEVEGAAGAAGAAHVDVDDGEAHQVGDQRDPVFGTGRVGVAVAGVLDQGRGRAGRDVGEFDRRGLRFGGRGGGRGGVRGSSAPEVPAESRGSTSCRPPGSRLCRAFLKPSIPSSTPGIWLSSFSTSGGSCGAPPLAASSGEGIAPVRILSTSCGGWTSIASFVPSRVVRYW